MKKTAFLAISFLLFQVLSCSKIEVAPFEEAIQLEIEKRSSPENDFFNYDYLSGVNPSIATENLNPVMSDMIDKTIDFLKVKEQLNPFVDSLKNQIGYPIWNSSREFISKGVPTAIIPFAFETGNHVTAFLIVIESNNILQFRLIHGKNIFNGFLGLGMVDAPNNVFMIMEYLLLEEIVFKAENCDMLNALDYITSFSPLQNDEELEFRECYIIQITQSYCITVSYGGITLGPVCENDIYYDYICFEDEETTLNSVDITPITGDGFYNSNTYTTSGYNVNDPALAALISEFENIPFDERGLTESESVILANNPEKIPGLTSNRNKATDFPEIEGCPPTGFHNGAGDALRHAYFSALNVKDFGVGFAVPLGFAHEDYPENPPLEKEMDLHNNQVGFDIAQQNPNATDEELGQLILDALNNGQLLVFNPAGTALIPSSGC